MQQLKQYIYKKQVDATHPALGWALQRKSVADSTLSISATISAPSAIYEGKRKTNKGKARQERKSNRVRLQSYPMLQAMSSNQH